MMRAREGTKFFKQLVTELCFWPSMITGICLNSYSFLKDETKSFSMKFWKIQISDKSFDYKDMMMSFIFKITPVKCSHSWGQKIPLQENKKQSEM